MLDWIVDERDSHRAVGDQGMRGTCLAWAISAVHEHARQLGPLSVEYLHWASGAHPGGRGTLGAARAVLAADGQPAEGQWPYDELIDETSPLYELPRGVVGPFHRSDVRVCPMTLDSFDQELSAGRCPVLALRVTDSFLLASGGVVLQDGPGSDGHAVAVVGLARYTGTEVLGDLQPGDRLVCVRNSWGDTWGVDGYALMSPGALGSSGLFAFAIDVR